MDPKSVRSETRGIVLTALPSEGYRGEVPVFPLPNAALPYLDVREAQIWTEAWSTPQAAAWSVQRWRIPIIAEYVRLKALIEMNANAAMIGQIHRYRDQLGLTPAGLVENGWAIAEDEVEAKRHESAPAAPKRKSARDRLKVVDSGDGA